MKFNERTNLISILDDRIQLCEKEEKKLGLLVVKIQRLRDVNAAFGYHTGDRVLDEIGNKVSKILRETDSFIKLSGNEYALVLPSIRNQGQAILAANRIIEDLKYPIPIDGNQVIVSVHIGIAIYPFHGKAAEQLMNAADVALADSKYAEDQYAIYSFDGKSKANIRLIVENELKKALNNSDIELYYQPKMSLHDHMTHSAEALARWHITLPGPVTTQDFINIAEDSEIIHPFSKWSINTALHYCARCQEKGKDFSVAVNLSPRLLNDPYVIEMVKGALNIWGLSPQSLILEITESAIMSNPETSMNILHQLDKLGVILSIDDFGTGYSSLAYLTKFPVKELKIDRSFIMGMAHNEDDHKIVRAIIDLAHNFDLQVVAEGVDSKETLDMLEAMNCDYAQGFYIAKALAEDEFIRWLSDKQPKSA